MTEPSVPRTIGDRPVVCWSQIDERHRITGACRHVNLSTGQEDPVPRFIAIVGGPGSYDLMRFTDTWDFITDTWHESLDEALHQAEFEYEGVSKTWNHV